MHNKRGFMALYSWFSRDINKPSNKSVNANSDSLEASHPARYINNCTMWPTAKIKEGIDVTLPSYDDQQTNLPKVSNKPKSTLENISLSLEFTLIVNK